MGILMSEGGLHPRIELGAYLLAVLPPADEAAITAHLEQCDECVLTVMSLADTLPALRRLDAAMMLADQQAMELSEGQGDSALEHAMSTVGPMHRSPANVVSAAETTNETERAPAASIRGAAAAPSGPRARRRASDRMRWGTGLAAIAAAAAVVLFPAILGDGPTGTFARPSASPSATSSSTAGPSSSESPTGGSPLPMVGAQSRTFEYTGSDTVTVTYAATSNGSAVNVRCQSGSDWKPQPGDASRTYELWIVRQDGQAVWVRSWPPVHGDATFPGWVDFLPQQFKSFQLRDGDGNVLAETDA